MAEALHVAAVAITRGEEYIMQNRIGEPSIGAAGLIGFFGGKVEKTKNGGQETSEQAARRELSEETDLVFPNTDPLEEIDTVNVESDYKGRPVTITMTIFGFVLLSNVRFGAKEGKVVAMTKAEALANLDKLTPATRAYFEKKF